MHLHGLGQIAKSVQEAAHRGLGRNAAALRTADAIGDRGDHLLARLGQLGTEQGAGEIFVVLAPPGLRGEPNACPYARLNRRHRTDSARLPVAWIATRCRWKRAFVAAAS